MKKTLITIFCKCDTHGRILGYTKYRAIPQLGYTVEKQAWLYSDGGVSPLN